MKIRHWPKEDRPREKLLNKGAEALTDAELLAILLHTGTRNKTALDIAKELLIEHDNLKALLGLPKQMLLEKKGLGVAKYASLQAAIELGRRCLHQQLPIGTMLHDSFSSKQFLSDRLRDSPHEIFACLYLDSQYRLISFEELFRGTIDQTAVYPREIVKRGLQHNAANIILAHNHPSGEARPSEADKQITLLIKEALALVAIQVVDHIIIGNPGHFSFKEKNLL